MRRLMNRDMHGWSKICNARYNCFENLSARWGQNHGLEIGTSRCSAGCHDYCRSGASLHRTKCSTTSVMLQSAWSLYLWRDGKRLGRFLCQGVLKAPEMMCFDFRVLCGESLPKLLCSLNAAYPDLKMSGCRSFVH